MNKLLQLFAAFIAVTGIAFADVMLTESLSVGGFVDMSYTDGDNRESTSGIDAVEFDFSFKNEGPVSAQIDIEYENSAGNSLNVEEAYITYDLMSGGVVTVGRFETMLLQDDSESTGLYQYSNAYDFYGSNFNAYLYDLGDQGIKYSKNGFAISLVDDGDSKIGDGNVTATDTSGGYSIEVGYKGKLAENLNGFIGARFYENSDNNSDGDLMNAYVDYTKNAWLFGAEIVLVDIYYGNSNELSSFAEAATIASNSDADFDLYSVFANYSYSDKNSVTFRYSELSGDITSDGAITKFEADKLTFAHNQALSNDLALILEYSSEDSKYAQKQDIVAVELLYAF